MYGWGQPRFCACPLGNTHTGKARKYETTYIYNMIHDYMYMHIHTHTCVCAYIYIYIYVYIYIYIYICINMFQRSIPAPIKPAFLHTQHRQTSWYAHTHTNGFIPASKIPASLSASLTASSVASLSHCALSWYFVSACVRVCVRTLYSRTSMKGMSFCMCMQT